jgi:hypothetical protein
MSIRTVWLGCVAAFFLMAAAWAVALPVNGTYDERQHVVRAYAVAHGDLFPSARAVRDYDGYAFDAPASLLPENADCTWRKPPQPASCQHSVTDRSVVPLQSYSARYSPVYFLPVGLPMLISPDRTGVVLGRLVSALMSALLLASAVVAAVRLGDRLVVAAIALVSTPMAMNLNGSVNPNGLEIAAGVLLFATLLALLRGAGLDDPATARRLVVLAGVATFLLLTIRLLGPLLVAFDVAACAVLAGRGRLRALAARPDARWAIGGAAALGVAFTAYWTLAARLIHVVPLPGQAVHLDTWALLRRIASVRAPFYLHQIVGQFSYGETTISKLAIYGWYALVAALVLPALLLGGRRVRLVTAGLAVACGLLLVTLEARYAPVVGWSQHGRYAMPALVGMVLVPAYGGRLAAWLTVRGRLSRFVVGIVAATVPLHLYALARVMTRFQVGIDAPLDPLRGSWHPPVGSVTPLVTALTGLVLLVGIAVGTAGAAVRPRTRQGTRPTTTVGRSSPTDR